jgi:hypothetical protein
MNADPPKVSTVRAHTGHGSLAQPIRSGTALHVEFPVCGDEPNLHATNLNQKTVSFWYFYDGPDPAPGFAHISVSVERSYFPEPAFAVRQWTKASLLLDGQQFATVSRIGYSYIGGDLPGPGTLYVDDIRGQVGTCLALSLPSSSRPCSSPASIRARSRFSHGDDAGSEEQPPLSRDALAPADALAADAPVAPDAPAPDAPPAIDTAGTRDVAAAPAPDGAPACAPGTHRCGQACLRTDDLASCGQRCEPCPNPAPGTVACVQVRLSGELPVGLPRMRVPLRLHQQRGDLRGQLLSVRGGPERRLHLQRRGVRDPLPGRFLTCPSSQGTACLASVIGFESASYPTFVLGGNSLGVDPPVVTTKRAHSGTSSLMQALRARAQAHIYVGFCPPNSLDLLGKRLSLWYYFDGTPPPGARIGLGISGANAGTTFGSYLWRCGR